MKTLSIITGILWMSLAVSYGIGLTEPNQFVYTGMAVLLAAEEFLNYFQNS